MGSFQVSAGRDVVLKDIIIAGEVNYYSEIVGNVRDLTRDILEKMNLRARKIYEALFALEDLREIFRQALPTGLDESEEEQLSNGIARVETILRDLKEGGRIIRALIESHQKIISEIIEIIKSTTHLSNDKEKGDGGHE
ncbi:MAG: hypothetical protein H8D26_06395 [Methanomicrobia archaeon]|nr:hypothetical protein [Methanomicrobia archaeon]